MLFLTFEEMKADTKSVVERIAALMGVELTSEHRFDVSLTPWTSSEGPMIRRGERGTPGELISGADQQRIDDYRWAELTRLGSDFPYDQAFASPN